MLIERLTLHKVKQPRADNRRASAADTAAADTPTMGKRADSLPVRLLRSMLGALIGLAILNACVQIGFDYHHADRDLTRDIEALEGTFAPGLADAMWGLNADVVTGILSGMIQLPSVVGARVVDEGGKTMAAIGIVRAEDGSLSRLDRQGHATGVALHAGLFDTFFSRSFDLVHTDPHGRSRGIGEWTVYFDRWTIVTQITDDVEVLLVTAFLRTLILYAIFFVVIRRIIGQPLQQLALQVRRLNIDNLDSQPFTLRDRGWHELHALTSVLNMMARKIRGSVQENTRLVEELTEINATLQARVEQRTRELEQLATTDPLTGLANRRKLDQSLAYERLRAERFNNAFSLVIIDLDHFKSVNDVHGHHAGDLVLQHFAKLLRGTTRGTDIIGRWGGEEFLVICPHTTREEAAILAERVRATAVATEFPAVGLQTCSIGIAQFAAGEDVQSALARADAALYRAKQAGRNRFELADQPTRVP